MRLNFLHSFPVAALVAALVASMGLSLPAGAQYREGQPMVLAPVSDPQSGVAAPDDTGFRSAYAKAGSPRITVFWNRQLSDTLTTQYDQVQQAEVHASAGQITRVSPSGNALATVRQSSAVATLREGERALPQVGEARSLLSERSEWSIASAFSTRLQRAGVRLVDRNMAMRSQAAGETAADRRDVQGLEIKALQGNSELLAEVLQTADPRAPFGVMFRVDIKDVSSGELLASVVSDGRPPARGPGRFVAGRKGFERERPPEATPADIGDVVAIATLNALAARWH